jgi:hypothetical protein
MKDDDDTLAALQKLKGMVPEPQEAHGLVLLLGNGLGEAMAGMRARQARLELARAEARRSASLEARRADVEASDAAVRVAQAEIRRLRVSEPPAGDGTVAVYGHVLHDGDPVRGAVVALVADDEVLVRIETDKAGSFALSVNSERALSLRISIGRKVVYRDDEATITPGPLAAYRLVELADSTTHAPTRRAYGADEQPGPSRPLPKTGGSLPRVLKELAARGVRVARVWLSASDDAAPKVTEISEVDGGVDLKVQGRLTDAGRLSVVAAVLAHQPEAKRAGMGSPALAAAILKAGKVKTWDDAERVSRLEPADVAERFGLDLAEAAALSSALAATIATIEIVEEG